MVHLPFDACLKLHNKLWCLHEYTGPSNERSCLKILDNCLAIVILAEKDSGKTSPFSSLFDPQSNKHQSFASDSAVFISSITALSLISNLFQISTFPL